MAKQRGLSFYRRKKKIGSTIFREIISYIFGIIIAVFLALVLTYFWGMSTKVIGDSMKPVLYNGQTIYIDRFSYMLSNPKVSDVVVFLPNGNENEHYYVKRVIAVGGDTVKIQDGICYVNGQESPYISELIDDPGIAVNEIKVDNGSCFCIGESPNNSEDSRSANIGLVNEKDILGKAWFHAGTETVGMGFVK
jgi:signal peptidase I